MCLRACVCVFVCMRACVFCHGQLNVIMNVCCQWVGVWWNGHMVACGAWPGAGMGLDSNEIIKWMRSKVTSIPN